MGPLTFLLAAPAHAFDIFKVLDPEGKNKDIQRAKQALEGVSGMVQSAEEIDYTSEFTIGESLALEGFQRYGLPVKEDRLQKYVNTLGNAVAKNSSRPQIPYYFVVVDSPVYCAFSCPGGIIFVSKALFKGMKDEAELACVLAHEVSHVSHKHALTSVKRAKFFEGAAKIGTLHMDGEEGKQYRDLVGNLQSVLFDKGLDQNMEFEADASAMEVAYRTGYDPYGMIRVLRMLQQQEAAATKKGSWFSTHPPLATRIDRCTALQKNYPDADDLARVEKRFNRHLERL